MDRIVAHARSDGLRGHLVLVLLAGVAICLTLAPGVGRWFAFELDTSSGVVGWPAVNGYPIQQDVVFYLLAVAALPLVLGLSWLCWVGVARLATRFSKVPPDAVLRDSALASSWMLTLLRHLPYIEADCLRLLPLPLGLAVLTTGCALIVRSRSNSVVPRPAEGDAEPPFARERDASLSHSADDSPRPTPDRSLGRVGALLRWVVAPSVICLATWYPGTIEGEVDLFHEAERLVPMDVMLRGGVPYRDVYLQHGLMENALIPYWGSHLFGPTVEGVRKTLWLIRPLGYLGFYFLGLVVFRLGAASALALVVVLGLTSAGWWMPHRYFLAAVSLALAAAAVRGSSTAFALPRRRSRADRSLGQWLALRAIPTRARLLLLSGVAAGLSVWHSLDAGVYTAVSLATLLLGAGLLHGEPDGLRRFLPVGLFAGGLALASLPFTAWLLWHGALDDFLRNSCAQVAYHSEAWGLAFPSLYDLLDPIVRGGWVGGWRSTVFEVRSGVDVVEFFGAPPASVFYRPLLLVLAAITYLTYRFLRGGFWASRSCVWLAMLTLFSVAFLRTAVGRSDGIHLILGSFPQYPLMIFAADRLAWRTRRSWGNRRRRPKKAVVLAAATFLALVGMAILGMRTLENNHIGSDGEVRLVEASAERNALAGPFVDGPGAHGPRLGRIHNAFTADSDVPRVVAFLRRNTSPGEPVLDFSSQAGLLFLADRPSATRYFQIVYAVTPAMQREVVHNLERQGVDVAILHTGSWADAFDGVYAELRQPLVFAHLVERFRYRYEIGETVIVAREPLPYPGDVEAPPP